MMEKKGLILKDSFSYSEAIDYIVPPEFYRGNIEDNLCKAVDVHARFERDISSEDVVGALIEMLQHFREDLRKR